MDSFQDATMPQSFSPGWGDPEMLEKTLTGREDLVDRLEELVRDGAGGPNKHQRLVVGPRGSGKTHVLRVLYNRLRDDEELGERLLIVCLLEDELGVVTFLDFVVRLLRAIARRRRDRGKLVGDLEELYDMPFEAQQGRAVQLLIEAAGDKDVLIIMENLGVMFDKTRGFGRKGQQALRNLVQKHPRFMIFGSSQALFKGVRDHDAPFYAFFKVIHLKRLTVDEAMRFLKAIASAAGNREALRFLDTPKGQARTRAIYGFTGGNHRLLVTFYEVLATDSLARLSRLFMKALNSLKPYYQAMMQSLSSQQQKIVQYLALEREPRPVKDIARNCLAKQNTISSQLKGLLGKNLVRKFKQGRESYYEITESLFRVCYETDLDREGAPAPLFVDFLADLYTTRESKQKWDEFKRLDIDHEASRRVDSMKVPNYYELTVVDAEPNEIAEPSASYGVMGSHDPTEPDRKKASLTNPEEIWPHFTIVTEMLKKGRLDEALEHLLRGLENYKKNKAPENGVLAAAFQENFEALFEYAPTRSFASFLDRALAIIDEKGCLAQLEASLPILVHGIIRNMESFYVERLEHILHAFDETMGRRLDSRIAVRLLEVGIDYFKKRDRKALAKLTLEERRMFHDQFDLDPIR